MIGLSMFLWVGLRYLAHSSPLLEIRFVDVYMVIVEEVFVILHFAFNTFLFEYMIRYQQSYPIKVKR